MDRALFHFSHKPVAAIRDVVQEAEPSMKPQGLWVSVGDGEDGWREWCEAESFSLKSLSHRHIIYVAGHARILNISSASEIDEFHKRFCRPTSYELKPTWKWPYKHIAWTEVANQYDGITIAPYIYERRFDDNAGWYYGWDCASGCIWRADAVSDVVLLP